MIVEQEYWDSSYKKLKLGLPQSNEATSKFLDKYIEPVSCKEMVEIGCFPGRFLPLISSKGYIINGIDMYSETTNLLGAWLEGLGISFNQLIVGDFAKHNFQRRFELVCSFGFVEHFENYRDVVSWHADLVDHQGLLIITSPNFSGWLQRSLHMILDRQNYLRHNIEAMDLDSWESVLKSKNFEIVFKGYYGLFDFWVDHSQPRPFLSFCSKLARAALTPLFKLLNVDAQFSAPYMGIVARRR